MDQQSNLITISYRKMINSMLDGIVMLDLQGKIMMVNKHIEKFFDTSIDQVKGKSFDPAWFFDDDQLIKRKQAFEKCLKEGTVSNMEIVSKTKYVSKEEALEIYKSRFENEPLLTEFVTADILPASIEVSTYKLADLPSVADILEKEPVVDEVVFERDIVATLQTWVSAIRNIGGGVVVFLFITSF